MRTKATAATSDGPSHWGRRRERQRGFTLIELLVVVGVIAILIGILLPTLSKARAQANRAVCLSNIRQLGAAIFCYCNDNHGYFPTCASAADGVGYVTMNEDWIWWQANRDLNGSAVAKYLGVRDAALRRIFRCPADSFENRQPLPAILPGQGPYLYSYNMNFAMGANVKNGPTHARSQIDMWRSPSRKIVLTENYEIDTGDGGWSYATPLTQRHGRVPTTFPPHTSMYANGWSGINVSAAFVDGHVEAIDMVFATNIYQIQPDVP